MSNTFSKTRAVLFAALALSAAALSTVNTASANGMRGGHMGGHGGGHMHGHRGHGYGNAMAAGMAVGIVGALIAAQARQPYAESYDPSTGERVRSQGPRGRHVVTRKDGKGKVVERKVVAKSPDWASSTDTKTGVTTTSTANGDGSRTVVQTSADGKILSSEVVR